MPEQVVILGTMHDAGFARLRARPGIDIQIVPDTVTDIRPHVAKALALIVRTAKVTAAVIEAAPELRVVSRHGVGYDNVDVEALTRRNVPLTLVGDINATPVAEQTLAHLLALSKRLIGYDRAARQGPWEMRNSLGTWEIAGKTILLLGFGRVGRAVARRCLAFDMRVLVYDPVVSDDAVTAAGCKPVSDFRAALPKADVLSLHLPFVPATRNIIGAREIATMKPTAILLNTARGGLVDETALLEALRSAKLAGAGLDVLSVEPSPADHPLLQLDNVIMSPHSAALTIECAIRMAEVSAQNVLDAFAGRLNPSLVVNPEVLN